MKNRERLGLALLERVIAAPGKVRLPNNPTDLFKGGILQESSTAKVQPPADPVYSTCQSKSA